MSEFDDRFEAKRMGVPFDSFDSQDFTEERVRGFRYSSFFAEKTRAQMVEEMRKAYEFQAFNPNHPLYNATGPFSNLIGNRGPNGKPPITVEGEDVTRKRLAK